MKLKEAMEAQLAEQAGWSKYGYISRRSLNDLSNEELIDLISETVGELKPTRGLSPKEED